MARVDRVVKEHLGTRPPIAVDASWLQLGTTGVGRYLANLLPRVAERRDVVALIDARRPQPDIAVEFVALKAPRGVSRLGWLEVAVTSWLRGFDGLFHGAAYAVPLRHNGPCVTSLHDVAWETLGVDQGKVKRRIWQLYGRHSASVSGALLTLSDFSKQAIVDVYGVDPESVFVAMIAPDPIFESVRAKGAAAFAASHGFGPRYVVALGGAKRRNLPMAIDAWRRVRDRGADVDMVVVGSEHPPAEPGLAVLGFLDDADWATVLAGATAFIYPTSHEGFGLPAAEAMASGTPVVCARVGSLPEVLGDSAAWSDGLDLERLAGVLADLLEHPEALDRLRSASLERASRFATWDDTATTTIAAYDRAWSLRQTG